MKSRWIKDGGGASEKGAYPCERTVFQEKDSKFDADLVLGLEDGKARFSLEFPKKKK